MKKFWAALVIILTFAFAMCAPSLARDDAELTRAKAAGVWIKGKLSKTITEAEMGELLSKVIEQIDPDKVAEWDERALSGKREVTMDYAALYLLIAAEQLNAARFTAESTPKFPGGKSAIERALTNEYPQFSDLTDQVCVSISLAMENQNAYSYPLSAVLYALGRVSPISNQPLLSITADALSEPISRETAIRAALRFFESIKSGTDGTVKMRVKIYADCDDYNHVGKDWGQEFIINDEDIQTNAVLSLREGEKIAITTIVTEYDSYNDTASKTTVLTVEKDDLSDGFTVTQTVSVKENRGRYSGCEAQWEIAYIFTPIP